MNDVADDQQVADPVCVVPQNEQRLDVAIVSINYHPEPTGISVYTTGTAEFIAAAGHSVTVFTGFPYYPGWSKRPEDRGRAYRSEQLAGVQVHRCYLYVPQKPTAIKRIAHELSFVASAGVRYLCSRRRTVTVIVSPPLALGFTIGALAKLKKSRVVLHIQDLQPDAAVELGMLRPGLLTRLLFGLERAGYRLADRISTISTAMRLRIESKGNFASKTMIFKNWASSSLVQPMNAKQSLKADWGLLSKFVVLYSGNMGVKQGLSSLLVAAQKLRSFDDIVFVVVGDGGEKNALLAKAGSLGLSNLRFESTVVREQLSRLLATADISLITQKSGINDLVLPSKLANIMTSQRPVVVQANTDSELARIVAGNCCGLVVAPEDGDATADAILLLRNDPVQRGEMAARGAAVAREQFGETSILTGFIKSLTTLSELRVSVHAASASRHNSQ